MHKFSKHGCGTLFSIFTLVGLLFLLAFSGVFRSASQAANEECQDFPQTGFQVCGRFLQYWRANGGLTQQGYPISQVFQEKNADPPAGDGNVHQVQYFQRARFELHPENSPPYDVLLGLLGAEELKARYGSAGPPISPTVNNPNFTGSPGGSPVPPLQAFVNFTTLRGALPGGTALVEVQTTPGAFCSIEFYLPGGAREQAAGLYSKNADLNGVASWTWTIAPDAPKGTGKVTVTCKGAITTGDLVIG